MVTILLLATSKKSNVLAFNVDTLDLNDTWVSGTIASKDEVDMYMITIPSSGWLTCYFQGWSVGDAYFYLINSDMTKTYVDYELYTSSDTNPLTKQTTTALEAGTYYIKIDGYSKNVGDYKLKASFKAANNNQVEPNNEFSSAMKLEMGQSVNGFFTMDNNLDFYSFTLTSKTCIQAIYTSYTSDTWFEIWNKDFVSMYRKELYTGSESNPLTYQYEKILDPGTYYFKLSPYSSNVTGRYTLKLINKVLVSDINISNIKNVESGKSFKLNATTKPYNVTDKSIKWSSGDTYIASVNEDTGMVTTYKAGVVSITASAQDGSNTTKTVTIVVKPGKISSQPYVTAGGNRKIYVSWNGQYGVSGYQIQYSTSSKFKNAETINVGKDYTNKYIHKLGKNKNYYVRVRSYVTYKNKKYVGAWSSKTRIKVY